MGVVAGRGALLRGETNLHTHGVGHSVDVLAGEVMQGDLVIEKNFFFCEFNSRDPGTKRGELLLRFNAKMVTVRSVNVDPQSLLNLFTAHVFKAFEHKRNFSLNNFGWDLASLSQVQRLVGSPGKHLLVIVVEFRSKEVIL